MLSIISQSGMGYTDRKNNTCGYGHYTFTRNADYSKVGSAALTSDDTDYKTAISDYQRLEKATSKEYEKKNSVMLKNIQSQVEIFMKQNGHTIKVRNLRLSSQEMKPMTSPTQVFVE